MSGVGAPPPPPAFKSDADLTIADTKRASLIADHKANGVSSDEDSIDLDKEIYDSTAIDPVLAKKMALANSALDEIGMTGFQWKLFYLNGFGYAVDSVCEPDVTSRFSLTDGDVSKLLIVCQSIAGPAVAQEFGNPSKRIAGVALASQVGLLVGAAVWG